MEAKFREELRIRDDTDEYDDGGRRLRNYHTYDNGKKWSNQTWEYNSDKRLVSHNYNNCENESDTTEYEYKYNSGGKVKSEDSKSSDGSWTKAIYNYALYRITVKNGKINIEEITEINKKDKIRTNKK